MIHFTKAFPSIFLVAFLSLWVVCAFSQPNNLGADRLVCGRAYEYITNTSPQTGQVWNTGEKTNTIKIYESGKYFINLPDGTTDTVDIYIKNEKKYTANHWIFGKQQYIQFDTNTFNPSAQNKTNPNFDITGGSAAYTNPSGKLIFYTNGQNLYDSLGTVIESGLTGDVNISQNSLFVRQPQSAVLVYLFTIQNNNLYYSIIDLSLNNGKGGIIPNSKNILLASNISPKMTANRFGEIPNEYAWLITQSKNSNEYLSFKLNAFGIASSPVNSNAGEIYTTDMGYLKFSSDGSMLGNSGEFTQLLGFDGGNGTVKLKHLSRIKNTNGIDFSNDGTKLYFNTPNTTIDPDTLSVRNGGSIYSIEVYAQDKNGNATFPTKFVYETKPNSPIEFGALQMAPNRELVVAQQNPANSQCLGKVSGSAYTPNAFCFSNTTGLNLPNFYQFDFKPQASSYVWKNDVCFGQKTVFKADSPLKKKPYADFKVNITLNDPLASTQTYTITDSLEHIFSNYGPFNSQYQIVTKCEIEPIRNIGVTIPPLPKLDISDTTLCTGKSSVRVNLANNNFNNFTPKYELYAANSTLKKDSVQTPEINITGKYKAVVSFSYCMATDEFEVKQDNSTSISLGPDIDTCIGQSVELKLKVPKIGSYRWSNGATSESIIVNSDGLYSLNFDEKNACTSSDNIEVRFYNPANDNVNITSAIMCKGDTVKLFLTNSSTLRLWQNNTQVDTFKITKAGNYTTRLINQGCTTRVNTNISMHPIEDLGFDKTLKVCANLNQFLTLDGGQGSDFEWIPYNESSAQLKVSQPGLIFFKKTDPNNCIVKDTIEIFSACSPVVYVPDIFTPNGDDKNETFKPTALHINQYELKIFDRWGNMIFYSTDPNIGWDGKYKGADATDGNYSYVIKYDGEKEEQIKSQIKSGTFYLLR
jgi:gliding motility-associated-like protein